MKRYVLKKESNELWDELLDECIISNDNIPPNQYGIIVDLLNKKEEQISYYEKMTMRLIKCIEWMGYAVKIKDD